MQMQTNQNSANLQQQQSKEYAGMEANYQRTQAYQNGSGNDPYSGWGSSGGSAAAGAAVGMMSGMAMGATMGSASRSPQQPTAPYETTNNYYGAPPSYGAPTYGAPAPSYSYQSNGYQAGTLTSLPLGSTPVTVGGQQYFMSGGNYYKASFNGSQVVYQAAQP